MSGLSKEQRLLLSRVDEVLHYLWDPIGVRGVPQARDEYSSYAGHVFSLIHHGAAEQEIIEYLRKIRIEHMGIGQPGDDRGEAEIVDVLINWKVAIDDLTG